MLRRGVEEGEGRLTLVAGEIAHHALGDVAAQRAQAVTEVRDRGLHEHGVRLQVCRGLPLGDLRVERRELDALRAQALVERLGLRRLGRGDGAEDVGGDDVVQRVPRDEAIGVEEQVLRSEGRVGRAEEVATDLLFAGEVRGAGAAQKPRAGAVAWLVPVGRTEYAHDVRGRRKELLALVHLQRAFVRCLAVEIDAHQDQPLLRLGVGEGRCEVGAPADGSGLGARAAGPRDGEGEAEDAGETAGIDLHGAFVRGAGACGRRNGRAPASRPHRLSRIVREQVQGERADP